MLLYDMLKKNLFDDPKEIAQGPKYRLRDAGRSATQKMKAGGMCVGAAHAPRPEFSNGPFERTKFFPRLHAFIFLHQFVVCVFGGRHSTRGGDCFLCISFCLVLCLLGVWCACVFRARAANVRRPSDQRRSQSSAMPAARRTHPPREQDMDIFRRAVGPGLGPRGGRSPLAALRWLKGAFLCGL